MIMELNQHLSKQQNLNILTFMKVEFIAWLLY